jgi:nucleotide-binding universal stress UspA family protein
VIWHYLCLTSHSNADLVATLSNFQEATMLPIKTILHPTDFSQPSEYAFQVACSLARDYGAKLIVLHVDTPPVTIGEVISYMEPEEYKEKLWAEFHRLEASEPGIRDLRVETKLVEGSPAKEILMTAREIKPELIVMGTHGRTGLGRLLMGSVAEEVVRKSPFPVLTVKTPTSQPMPIKAPKAATKLEEFAKV